MRNNALPHRKKEQKQLPLGKMVFDVILSNKKFVRMSRPVFNWSEEHKCRFFVRVFDQTKAEEKKIYKFLLKTVGDRFYHYEVYEERF